ncbi:MAG: Crp/Fnr family transcriptional regulator [Polyangiales bacterium]
MPTRTLEFGIPGVLKTLSDRLGAAIEDAEVRIRYSDGDLIQSRGDKSPGLSIVRAGAVRVGNVGADGAYLTMVILGPGQTFGEMTLFADLPRTFDAHAYGPTTIGHINKARFDVLLRDNPEIAEVFLRSLSTQLHAALEYIEDLRRLPLAVQVAKVLSAMIKMQKNSADLEATQQSLASTIGVTRIAVAHALAELEKKGLLRRGYRRIEIPDVTSLRAWVAENSQLTPAG